MATSVVLFNRVLRLHDHPALATAVRRSEHVVPLFVVDPAIADGPFGSPNRLAFLRDTLADLRGHDELGLLASEYDRVVELMGREPTDAELTMFAMQAQEETSRGIEVYLAVTGLYFVSAFAVNRVALVIEKKLRVPGMVGAH